MAKYDATESTINLSPLDFSYQFGLNDNSAQHFNYSDIQVMTNAMTSIASKVSSTSMSGNLVDSSSMLINPFQESTVLGYDITQFSTNSISYNHTLDFNKVSTLSTSYDNKSFINGILSDTLSFAMGAISTLTTKDSGDQVSNLISSVTDVVNQSVSMGFNIATAMEQQKDYHKLVNKQIELYNEKADANREFIQQCNNMIKQRQQRFEKSNKVIQGSKSK
jgi:hypothetical protein